MVRDSQVSVGVRLRPLRLAFIVDDGDAGTLQSVLSVTSCLWGGMYNPIIPYRARIPRSWQMGASRSPTDLVSGYLDAYEPDYVVITNERQRTSVRAPVDIIALSDVIAIDTGEVHYGVSAASIFAEEFFSRARFVERNPRSAVLTHPASPTTSLFAHAYAGHLPAAGHLAYVQRYFSDAFAPTKEPLTPSQFVATLSASPLLPIAAGSLGLRGTSRTFSLRDPTLFLLDASATLDVIDYWNLRALGWGIIPVPTEWSQELLPWCQEFVAERSLRGSDQRPFQRLTTLIGGRSLKPGEAEAYATHVRTEGVHGLGYQSWYPRIWDSWAGPRDFATRIDVAADESSAIIAQEEGRIAFDGLSPTLHDDRFAGDASRWANVITWHWLGEGDDHAFLLPRGLPSLRHLLGVFGLEEPRITSEGIVILSRYPEHRRSLRIPTGMEAFTAWFAVQGYRAKLSGAGRIALQLIKRLGGLYGVHTIKHPLLLRTLNEMAHGMSEYDATEGDWAKKVRGKMLSHAELLGKLSQAYPDSSTRAPNTLRQLVKCSAVRVGIRSQCPNCGQANWYSLSDIDDRVECERCLETYPFPAADPPPRPWYYRTRGPFSVENYAQGGYATALALHFLAVTLRATTSWIPSVEILREGDTPREIDFALWWRQSAFRYTEPSLLFGEAKGYGLRDECFTVREVSRARALAKAFPGAFHVFATLKSELTQGERARIGRLALAGRRSWKDERWIAPVLVLTANELFSDSPPEYSWKNMPNKRGEIAATWNGLASGGELQKLCDATQQVYLGLPSYWDWWRATRKV